MLTPRWTPLTRHAFVVAVALGIAAGMARAESEPSASAPADSANAVAFSSSSASLPDGMSLAAEPSPAGNGAQYDRSGAYRRRGMPSRLTFEAGGGFNAPTPDTSSYLSWGGNFTGGVGYRFSPVLSLLAEYQFIDSKLPAAVIAPTGANGGHAHIWSLTLSPVVDLFPNSRNGVYLTGGGGFYRKVTSFTDPVASYYCDYYYCYYGTQNVVVGHFSSNQGGLNGGLGFYHRIGDRYSNSNMRIFAEARYLDILTPAVTTSASGLPVTSVGADTIIIPVTFGVRW
jgi:hypothetical protein